MERSPQGLFLVLEGVEGVGKSTQARLLSAWLAGLDVAHTMTREPGGTGLGEAIRSLVLERSDLAVSIEAELLLILAARTVFVKRVVRPALEKGEVVVSDRYDLSTLAYQGWGRGIDLDTVKRLNSFATGGLRPDLYLLLDLSAVEGLERQRLAGKTSDRLESEGEAFLSRVREGYLALSASEDRVRALDGSGPPEAVHARVKALLQEEFPETFGPPVRY